MLFRDHSQYSSIRTDLISTTGCTSAEMDAVSSKLTFGQILTLLWQFGAQFGPQLFAAVSTILADIQNGTITQLPVLEQLIATYGPAFVAMATVIASWFGITLPTIPGLPTPPANTLFKAHTYVISH